jgi:2-polyprenyl-3-methyl-5-hydroxy-6-metoxy-1,4-benzoquinol methylase
MVKCVIEKDREYGYLRANSRPSTAMARRKRPDCGSNSRTEILDHLEDICGQLSGRRLFDVGCRDGAFLDQCFDRGINCAGWEDVSEWADRASEKGYRVLTADFERALTTRGRKYDIVTLLNVLEYVEDPARVLIEIRQNLLSDRGTLVATVPNTFTFLQCIAKEEFGLEDWWVAPDTISNYFNSGSLFDLLEGCGFNVIEIFSDIPQEIFMLAGDLSDDDPIETSLRMKTRFNEVLRRQDKQHELKELKSALGRLALGNELVAFAEPNSFSKACRATVVKNWLK